MTLSGDLITVDDRPALRFERRLKSSVERVWRAVTEPDELERWFIARIPWTPTIGEKFEAFGEPGTVTELERPRLIAWEWGGELLRIELAPEGDGCRIVLTHVFDDRNLGAQHASGWEWHLDRLAAHLAGGYLPQEDARASVIDTHEAYAQRFRLDPEPGRRAIEQYHPAR
jgi:uncharacterized protein YndB with AHSA1/START domain